MIKYKKYQVAGKTQLNKSFIEGFDGYSNVNSTDPTKSNFIPSPTLPKDNWTYQSPTTIPNYPAKQDNIRVKPKVNIGRQFEQNIHNKGPETYYTPVTFSGKSTTYVPPVNQGHISQQKSRTLYNTYFNSPKNTHGTGAIPFISNMINIGDAVGLAQGVKQGVKYGINKIPKRSPSSLEGINQRAIYGRNILDNAPIVPKYDSNYRIQSESIDNISSNKNFTNEPQGRNPVEYPTYQYKDDNLYPAFHTPTEVNYTSGIRGRHPKFVDVIQRDHKPYFNKFVQNQYQVPKRPPTQLKNAGPTSNRYNPRQPKKSKHVGNTHFVDPTHNPYFKEFSIYNIYNRWLKDVYTPYINKYNK